MPLWDHLVVESQREYVCLCKLLVVRHLEHGSHVGEELGINTKLPLAIFERNLGSCCLY